MPSSRRQQKEHMLNVVLGQACSEAYVFALKSAASPQEPVKGEFGL